MRLIKLANTEKLLIEEEFCSHPVFCSISLLSKQFEKELSSVGITIHDFFYITCSKLDEILEHPAHYKSYVLPNLWDDLQSQFSEYGPKTKPDEVIKAVSIELTLLLLFLIQIKVPADITDIICSIEQQIANHHLKYIVEVENPISSKLLKFEQSTGGFDICKYNFSEKLSVRVLGLLNNENIPSAPKQKGGKPRQIKEYIKDDYKKSIPKILEWIDGQMSALDTNDDKHKTAVIYAMKKCNLFRSGLLKQPSGPCVKNLYKINESQYSKYMKDGIEPDIFEPLVTDLLHLLQG